MKVGIMGGTFDPIHIGHLLAAESARDSYQLDEVWFMPSHIPPHKEAAGAAGKQRLEMVTIAIQNHPSFRLLDIEIARGGVSYTIDTIRELKKQYEHIDFHFIIGADMVNYLPKWAKIEELIELVTFIGLQRPGTELELDELPSFIRDKVLLAEMPLIDISSSLIRDRIANGRSIRYMVPKDVHEYIVRSGLYEIHT
ncbi:nicotinate-nucleotide adenylyltransferase [Paenibacillus sediminis]|uniref:Probable nicotinate-nucleotide adenylyltransferase n=1 Tax=Paenibacillus sediminis TaxID=664909 RepID=A0ABS4GZP0_9BACL|nr:nicotinate-nucleotide adenylyltransferase [Paenibacillus sediminis]MBP1935350.1 nicotinate-nucleotide adenylyltransferase [Paenibacillus sediminis]